MKLKVVIADYPYVLCDDVKVKFPTKKAQGLFYYLVITKSASRELLAYLFWPDFELDIGKKNLRNILYYIKKAMNGVEIFEKQNNVISIFSYIAIEVEHKSGVLFKDFYIEDCSEFNEFIDDYRNTFEAASYNSVKYEFTTTMLQMEEAKALSAFLELKQQNPYDEELYSMMMAYYNQNKEFSKSINIYKDIQQVLNTELDISPGEELKAIYEVTLKLWQYSGDTEKSKFYGRYKEINRFNTAYLNFLSGKAYNNIIVTSLEGGGKTFLLSEFSNMVQKNTLLVNITCCEEEKNLPFHILYSIANEISDQFNTKKNKMNENIKEQLSCTERMKKLLKTVLQSCKIIVCIDDIQYIDDVSMLFLLRCISPGSNKNLLLIATLSIESGQRYMRKYFKFENSHNLEILQLNNFTIEETKDIVKETLGNQYTAKTADIYNETDGNPLLLNEYCCSIISGSGLFHSRFTGFIKNKVNQLKREQRKILYLSSLYPKKIDHRAIAFILKKNIVEILDSMELLAYYGFYKEEEKETGVYYRYSSESCRKEIYMQLSIIKRTIYHNEMAAYLENSGRCCYNSDFCGKEILYHYRCANNKPKILKYEIMKLESLINLNTEFPEFLNKIAVDSIYNIEKYIYDADISCDIRYEFFLIRGSYEIKTCNYILGIQYLKRISDFDNNTMRRVKAHKQLIYYGIQIRNLKTMRENITDAFRLINEYEIREEIGELLKLSGLYYIMLGEFRSADRLLKESYEFFRNTEQNNYNLYHMACIINYRAYIYKYNGEYAECIKLYIKAISICEENKIENGLAVFYTNMGQSLYHLRKNTMSKRYFSKAMELYKRIDTMWSRGITEGYLALLFFDEGNYTESREHLKTAINISEKLRNLYETTFIYVALCKIKKVMMEDKEVNQIYVDIVYKDYDYYEVKAERGLKLLNMHDTIG